MRIGSDQELPEPGQGTGLHFRPSHAGLDACSYETSGSYNRGLKTGDTYLTQNTGTPTTSTTAWSQSYGYDNNLDYLTSASYGDSKPNASQMRRRAQSGHSGALKADT